MRPSDYFAAGWLAFVVQAAIYGWIDRARTEPQLADPHQGLPFLQDPNYQGSLWGTAERLEGPSWDHWLGTDLLGRDLLARIVAGMHVVAIVVVVGAIVGIVLGAPLGALAARVGDRGSALVMWVPEVIDSLPRVIFLLAVISIHGLYGPLGMAMLLGVFTSAAYARGVRSHTKADKPLDLPIERALLSMALANGAVALGIEFTLSFLGLGTDATNWGVMVNEGRSELRTTLRPILVPSFFLVATVASLNHLSDALGRPDKQGAFGVHCRCPLSNTAASGADAPITSRV